jgi:hypothetical protein
MAEPEHDDLADALARMAAGDIAPSEHEPAPPAPPAKAVRPTVTRPAVTRPASARPPAAEGAGAAPKPPTTVPPVRQRPASPTVAVPPAPPSRPATPAAPVIAPATSRRARPAAPVARSVTVTHEQTQSEINGGLSIGADDGQVIDDDDSVIVPAPDPSVFDYRSKKVTADARAKVLRQKNLNYLRTLIPILFTFGILLIAFASLKFLSGQDSMLSSMPIWIPVILIFGALVFFTFMAICMVVVKKMLAQG